MTAVFESAVHALSEALRHWNRGASPGLLSRAAVQFDQAARDGDERASVGSAVARGLAGDLEGARRRLMELIAAHPDRAAPYVALGVMTLRDPDPLGQAPTASWALSAGRDLAPGVGCIERMLAQALATQGEFMSALQSARAAMALDRDDEEARRWSALLRLYFGGDLSAATVLSESAEESELMGRSPAVWLSTAAGLYTRGEFHDARGAMRRVLAPFRSSQPQEAALITTARRWYRELKGFGPGVAMAGERTLRDVGGAQSDYVRTRAALSALKESLQHEGARGQDGVSALDIDSALGELEARTRRGMLEWGARLVLRGFAEAYLPMVAYLEAPSPEVLAAMDLVVLDG